MVYGYYFSVNFSAHHFSTYRRMYCKGKIHYGRAYGQIYNVASWSNRKNVLLR